ncbi:hypothetical protein IM660_13165 [Ruania alkalisoli]|uniref:Uncharacterized protein n=1 Tax=Ruania alkalisoli TaxID=2779775 RepID=A0A7M1SPY6_9MICO|nr:hypothetical protein [Ruania alkalisoli]QOR69619.1 hypothetical protein IM660_13165 [Ruania alkalisoli]
MGGVSEERFRRLARSSPWLWQRVAFTASWRGPHAGEPVRAWIERPARMRVEDLQGQLLEEEPPTRQPDRPRAQLTTTFGWSPLPPDMRQPMTPSVPSAPRPRFADDGLVAERFGDEYDHDVPMYVNYHWVAMFDARELADSHSPRDGTWRPGTLIESVREVTHHGRPAWEAVLRPTADYDPRCSCCPLLDCAVAAAEYLRPDEPRREGGYATRFEVRLDSATGICVSTRELDGPRCGDGHDVRIEAAHDQAR